MKRKTIALLFLLVVILVSCAKKQEQEKDAITLFKEGMVYFKNEKYEEAAAIFEEALKKADTPELAAKAQLFLADSYYLDEKYDDAITAYKSYLELYKEYSDAKRAMLRLGLSYYAMLQPIDKDQSYTRHAYETFLELKSRYPEYAKKYKIDKKIIKLKNMLAEKDFYVAKFYVRIGEKKASILRLKKIMKEYKDTKIYPDAVILYAKVMIDLDKPVEAVKVLNKLLEERPNPEYLSDINKLLTKLRKKVG